MDIERVNGSLVQAIERLQGNDIDSLAEVMLKDKYGDSYEIHSPSGLQRKFAGKGGGLTKFTVKRLRKEFLQLMGNVKKVKNYREARDLQKAFYRWRDHYEQIVVQIRGELRSRVAQDKRDNHAYKADKEDAEHYIENQDAIWNFESALGWFPLRSFQSMEQAYKGLDYKPYSRESLFDSFKSDLKKWDGQVRRRARAAWNWLNEFVEWTERKGVYGRGGGRVLPVKYPEKKRFQNVNLQGFSVQLNGYDNEKHKGWLDNFERGLAVYKKRAARVFPWLLKYKIPFVLNFDDLLRSQHGDAAASYEQVSGGVIHINPWTMFEKKPDNLAKILAHEMGHHVYDKVFSGDMRDGWYKFWRGSPFDLDLRDVVAKRRPGESSSEFRKRLQKEDPIMALQIDSLIYDPANHFNLFTINDIEKHIKDHDPVIRVPGKPISGYAARNNEEGFCETLGLLVGHGPKALLPEVRAMLKSLFPSIKLESSLSSDLEFLIERTEKQKGKIRASKLKYVHFTDPEGALGMVKEKKIWQSGYAGYAVYAVAVGGAFVPGVQLSKAGRAPKGRDVAIIFTTDEFPDKLYPEEVLWHKKEIRIKSGRIVPAKQAIKLLDGSLVVDDKLKGIPRHPTKDDWTSPQVWIRDKTRMSTGRPV